MSTLHRHAMAARASQLLVPEAFTAEEGPRVFQAPALVPEPVAIREVPVGRSGTSRRNRVGPIGAPS